MITYLLIGTPNYYVQKLFPINKGTKVKSILQNNEVIAAHSNCYTSVAIDRSSNELIVKIVNKDDVEQKRDIVIEGGGPGASAILTALKAGRFG